MKGLRIIQYGLKKVFCFSLNTDWVNSVFQHGEWLYSRPEFNRLGSNR